MSHKGLDGERRFSVKARIKSKLAGWFRENESYIFLNYLEQNHRIMYALAQFILLRNARLVEVYLLIQTLESG